MANNVLVDTVKSTLPDVKIAMSDPKLPEKMLIRTDLVAKISDNNFLNSTIKENSKLVFGPVERVANIVSSNASKISNSASTSNPNTVSGALNKALADIGKIVNNFMNTTVKEANKLIDPLYNALRVILESVRNVVGKISEALVKMIQSIGKVVMNFFDTIFNKILPKRTTPNENIKNPNDQIDNVKSQPAYIFKQARFYKRNILEAGEPVQKKDHPLFKALFVIVSSFVTIGITYFIVKKTNTGAFINDINVSVRAIMEAVNNAPNITFESFEDVMNTIAKIITWPFKKMFQAVSYIFANLNKYKYQIIIILVLGVLTGLLLLALGAFLLIMLIRKFLPSAVDVIGKNISNAAKEIEKKLS